MLDWRVENEGGDLLLDADLNRACWPLRSVAWGSVVFPSALFAGASSPVGDAGVDAAGRPHGQGLPGHVRLVGGRPALFSCGLSADVSRGSQEMSREGLCGRGRTSMRLKHSEDQSTWPGGRGSTGAEQAESHKPQEMFHQLTSLGRGAVAWVPRPQLGASSFKRSPSIGRGLLGPGPSPGCRGFASFLGSGAAGSPGKCESILRKQGKDKAAYPYWNINASAQTDMTLQVYWKLKSPMNDSVAF